MGAYPITRAVLALRQAGVAFEPFLYRYGGVGQVAREAAAAIGRPESQVLKTLVFQSEAGPLLVLVDAAHRVALGKLGRALGGKSRPAECAPRDAERITGYKVGGISPFGTRKPLPVVLDAAAAAEPQVVVNGGSHGFLVGLAVADLVGVLAPRVADVREA